MGSGLSPGSSEARADRAGIARQYPCALPDQVRHRRGDRNRIARRDGLQRLRCGGILEQGGGFQIINAAQGLHAPSPNRKGVAMTS